MNKLTAAEKAAIVVAVRDYIKDLHEIQDRYNSGLHAFFQTTSQAMRAIDQDLHEIQDRYNSGLHAFFQATSQAMRAIDQDLINGLAKIEEMEIQ